MRVNTRTRHKRRSNRKRLSRTRRHYRQTGGDAYSWTYTISRPDRPDIPSFSIADEEKVKLLEKNTTYRIIMENENSEGIKLFQCSLKFSFDTVGYLELLICADGKIKPYKYKSYLIIGVFLYILYHFHNIRTVYLMPSPLEDKGYIKLYNFYKNMGFVCIGSSDELNAFRGMSTNENRLSTVSRRKKGTNSGLKYYTDKGMLNTKNQDKIKKNCNYMAGSVKDILEKLMSEISKWRLEYESAPNSRDNGP